MDELHENCDQIECLGDDQDGEKYGTGTDVWSMACTIIEMLEGVHPWTCGRRPLLELMHKILQFMPIPQSISPHLQGIFNKIFVNVKQRASAEEIASEVWFQAE
ncbi:hypothetical protein B0H13DRAFT_1916724 [Mycena leptocephala]|nr:hypothetical protein B0H13DRAFT_1916724 [Mycena leptocephala]